MKEQQKQQPPTNNVSDSKNIGLTIAAVLIAALIAGGVAYLWQRSALKATEESLSQKINSLESQIKQNSSTLPKEESPTQKEEKTVPPTIGPESPKKSELKPIDEFWNLYTNYQLGFSLKVPRKVVYGDLEIIEKENIVYLVADKEYQYSTIQEKLADPNGSDFDKVKGVPWGILIKRVATDAELDAFIKERYGKGCRLGEKTISEEGIQKISIDFSNWDPEDPNGCFVNYVTEIRYSPIKKIVAAWDLGQAQSFEVDKEISESFKFIE